jgi:Na+/melibiose symporter-like transporter
MCRSHCKHFLANIADDAFLFLIQWTLVQIPDILATRYAMFHGLNGDQSCDSYELKPLACVTGSEEAQSAAAFWNFVTKGLTFVWNPIMGSFSDHGRKPILISGLFLSCLPASVFLFLVMTPTLHPFWFNIVNSWMGVVDMTSIMFATLSDTIPTQFRAAGFGLLMSAFYGGFALAPSLTLFLNAQQLAVTSLGLISTSFLFALFSMPETVSEDVRRANEEQRLPLRFERSKWIESCCYSLRRPFREMSILRRSLSLQMVTIVSFLSAMVFASDATLVLYYAQERLNVHPHDFATMFLLLGVVGILVQAAFLPPLLQVMGEHALLVASCLCGTVHNLVRSFLLLSTITRQQVY